MVSTSLLRLPEVLRRCAIGRSALYELVRRGEFPKPVKVQRRATAWVDAEVEAWIARASPSAPNVLRASRRLVAARTVDDLLARRPVPQARRSIVAFLDLEWQRQRGADIDLLLLAQALDWRKPMESRSFPHGCAMLCTPRRVDVRKFMTACAADAAALIADAFRRWHRLGVIPEVDRRVAAAEWQITHTPSPPPRARLGTLQSDTGPTPSTHITSGASRARWPPGWVQHPTLRPQ